MCKHSSAVPVRQRVRVALRDAWPELVSAPDLERAGVTSERAARRALNELAASGEATKAVGRRVGIGCGREPDTYMAAMTVEEYFRG